MPLGVAVEGLSSRAHVTGASVQDGLDGWFARLEDAERVEAPHAGSPSLTVARWPVYREAFVSLALGGFRARLCGGAVVRTFSFGV